MRLRRPLLTLLALAALLAPAAAAQANQAYDRVAAAYAQAGGQLDPCVFTQAQLEAALAGIPKSIADVVPDLRKAMKDGIAAHARGDCLGRKPAPPSAPASGGALPPPETSTAPPPVATQTTPASAQTTTPAPVAATPAPASAPAASGAKRDARPLVIALATLGALLLLALLLWGWARARGWDPLWGARARHAWGEAGFRTSTTWAEFTDWLRLGR